MAECNGVAVPVTGVGVTLNRFNGIDYDPIAQILDINVPDVSRDMIETSDMDSVDGFRDYIAGWKDGGSVAFNLNFIRETFDVLYADFNDDTKQSYRITIPDSVSTVFDFDGYVQSLGMPITKGEQLKANAIIKVTGKPTIKGTIIITTTTPTDIAATTAMVGGEVVSDGGVVVNSRGTVWNTTGAPTLADNVYAQGAGLGPFVGEVTGLPVATTIYVRAYAQNVEGESFGEEKIFTTI